MRTRKRTRFQDGRVRVLDKRVWVQQNWTRVRVCTRVLQVWLILGWVIIPGLNSGRGKIILVCNHPPSSTQPGHPSGVVAVNTGQWAVMLCGWGVKAGMACVWWQAKCVNSFKTGVIPVYVYDKARNQLTNTTLTFCLLLWYYAILVVFPWLPHHRAL